jgi:hypothetical protein
MVGIDSSLRDLPTLDYVSPECETSEPQDLLPHGSLDQWSRFYLALVSSGVLNSTQCNPLEVLYLRMIDLLPHVFKDEWSGFTLAFGVLGVPISPHEKYFECVKSEGLHRLNLTQLLLIQQLSSLFQTPEWISSVDFSSSITTPLRFALDLCQTCKV